MKPSFLSRSLLSCLLLVLVVMTGFLQAQTDKPAATRRPATQDNVAANAARLTKQWLIGDKNQDGKVSIDETKGLMKANFKRNDLDKDGFIDQKEMADLAGRLLKSRQGNANRGNTNQRNTRNNNRQSTVTTEQLLAQVPQGVTVVADIAYRQGNEAWQLDMALPSSAASQPRPAIVFIHGGGWRNGDKRATSFMSPMLDYAAKGYVCVSLNYRLIRDDSTTVKECVEDVKCAVRWLRAHAKEYNVDPNRIGATGNSAGAHLSAMLGLCPPSGGMEGDGPWQKYSSRVQAVCASATPSSFMIPMSKRGEARFKKAADDAEQKKRQKISPIHFVTAKAPPFLLFHEVSDGTVGFYQGDNLIKALKEAGAKEAVLMKFEDGSGHGVFLKNIGVTEKAREAFFKRTLGL